MLDRYEAELEVEFTPYQVQSQRFRVLATAADLLVYLLDQGEKTRMPIQLVAQLLTSPLVTPLQKT